jgi:hypothetical protein
MLLAGCSNGSLIDPYTADNGVEYRVDRIGEPIDREATAGTDAKTLCMFGLTAANKSGEDMVAADAQGTTYGDVSADYLEDVYKFSPDGQEFDGWPVPTDEWRSSELANGDEVRWVVNKECSDDANEVTIRLGDRDMQVPLS